jgi:CRP-like cAMP-binding protein
LDNGLLSGLPSSQAARLDKYFEHVRLSFGDTIYKSKALIDYVYFPDSGVLSMIGITAGDNPIEVGLIGSEGLAGLPVFLGVSRSANDVIVQADGTAKRIKVEHVLAEFAGRGALHDAILLFAHELFVQVSVTTSCNRHHEVEQRLSRWLLMMRDRGKADQLQLTQEFLSWMLGVRNQAVSRAAMTLQETNAIDYSRGTVKILNRKKLEQKACACYRMMAARNGHFHSDGSSALHRY